MFSHSSARALCDMTRNVPDDVLETLRDQQRGVHGDVRAGLRVAGGRAVAQGGRRGRDRRGGSARPTTWLSRRSDRRVEQRPKPKAHLDQVVAHIEHVRDVAGIDHVGIGGDYDGTSVLPVGLEDVSGYPRLFAALAERGWSDDDLAKLAGANILRVMRDAEAGARELQTTRGPSLATYEGLDGAGTPPEHQRDED